jgi:histone acetyltransferase (RNA polymerase elongator complex component)
MKRYYTIPVFIPEKACPFRCVYCKQYAIAGAVNIPGASEIREKIESYLCSIPSNAIVKAGFFGGNFTGMPVEEQNRYLEIVRPYIERGKIDSVQISTRPDYISAEILDNLKKFHVKIIELGAQSFDDETLVLSGRGHNADTTRNASAMILEHGFELGLQMMTGLPGDSFGKTINTAREIVSLGAHYTRIYPTLVIRDTHLEHMYKSGEYEPLTLEQSIKYCKELAKIFTEHDVTILRMGLHPSEGLITGKNLAAGPFHVSFKELVMTSLFGDLFASYTEKLIGNKLFITVSPKNINYAIGYNAVNKKMLLQKFKSVQFMTDDNISGLPRVNAE